jgi:transposase
METELKMSIKEADRYAVMRQLESRKITIARASQEIGVSYRQARRLWSRYKKEGPEGLISKRKGKPSNYQLAYGLKEKAMSLVRKKYTDYGPTLAVEKLQEQYALIISKETLRKLMIQEGLWKPKKKRDNKVYARRTRRSCIGELEQIDGSYEYWFEDRADKCCLLVCVDDATSQIMGMRFCHAETTDDYFDFIKDYLLRHGRPRAFYSDKHSVFRVNRKEQEEGKYQTLLHQALKQLDIELICAHSPQAKGRVERANGVLQDRLIKELREQGINSIEQGNAYLETFRLRYNKKFGKQAANPTNVHRELLPSHKLDEILLGKEERELSQKIFRLVIAMRFIKLNRLIVIVFRENASRFTKSMER